MRKNQKKKPKQGVTFCLEGGFQNIPPGKGKGGGVRVERKSPRKSNLQGCSVVCVGGIVSKNVTGREREGEGKESHILALHGNRLRSERRLLL